MRQMRVYKVYGADTETDTDGNTAWICQWCIRTPSTVYEGRDIYSFQSKLEDLLKTENCIIYFHNLKYDLSYIKYAIYNVANKYDYEINSVIKKNKPLLIALKPRNGGHGRMYRMEFRDSSLKIPGELRDMGKMIGLPKLEGYEFKYGWSKSVDMNDKNNWKYVERDAEIVAVAMQQLHAGGSDRVTASSDAWKSCQAIMDMGDRWNVYFPKIPIDVDTELREAYYGGLNISQHVGVNTGEFTHADVNSMYPSVMKYDDLPVGKPEETSMIPTDGLYVLKARMKFTLKPNIPFGVFQFRHFVDASLEGIKMEEGVKNMQFYHELTLSSVDLSTYSMFYDIDIDYSNFKCWKFKSRVGLLSRYIDYWYSEKKQHKKGDKVRYQIAKLRMNMMYGRFGMNPNVEDNILVPEGDDLKWFRTTNLEDYAEYMPYALFVTAHARRRLLEYVYKIGPENVIHCDTDSCIHYGKERPDKGIKYGKELGEWGIESRPVKVIEGGFKRYFEFYKDNIENTNDFSMACAGIPQKENHLQVPVGMWVEVLDNPELIASNETLGNEHYSIKSQWLRNLYVYNGMNPDDVNTLKLMPRTVKGGIVLDGKKQCISDNIRRRMALK